MGIEWWRNIVENKVTHLWNLVQKERSEISNDVFWERISFDVYNDALVKHWNRSCSHHERVEKKFYALYWDQGMPNDKEEFARFVNNCAIGITKNIISLADILQKEKILADDYTVIRGKESIFNEIFEYLSAWRDFQDEYEENKFLFEKIDLMGWGPSGNIVDSLYEKLEEYKV